MKTKLLTLAAITVLTFNIAQAQAATCESGKLVTGNNGHEYCQSNNTMNWWSAYTWCEAQGRHLATMYEVCPTWDGSIGSYKCANYNSTFYNSWTSTASQEQKAFRVHAGGVYNGVDELYRDSSTSDIRALCY